MNRREFLKRAAISSLTAGRARAALGFQAAASAGARRVRPGDPGWPSEAAWDRLRREVGGRLVRIQSPLAACRANLPGDACAEVFEALNNPFYIGDHPALTQTSGWLDAWTSAPSVYAVAAERTSDVVSAVNFAREHRLRLAVKGGGHSYQGTSCAPDSLLIWTRAMHGVELHDAFVPRGCAGTVEPQPAASIGAGAMWLQAYDAVTTKGGRYVQGGGCTTVGVAGLIQSGGFGSFSKTYGLAAAGLLEAEIVTADGIVRVANACFEPDLFWALKGGGGGSFGVVTRLTLRTHELPDWFGAVFAGIRASSGEAYRRLIDRVLEHYRDRLFNPHWGEQLRFGPGNTLDVQMLFAGLTREEAEAAWNPFVEWVNGAARDFSWETPLQVAALPAQRFWDPEFLAQNAPQFIEPDGRPGAPAGRFFWASNQGEAGQFLHGYRSAWLPAALLDPARRQTLTDALFGASRQWTVSLHCNKGLAGASAEILAAARDTATNPEVIDAFALAIIAGEGPPAFPGLAGHEPDLAAARREAAAINAAMDEILRAAPDAGSYVSESDYFERNWQRSFWGGNYSRLAAIKKRYDPDGLFVVHHGVGSEDWSDDGFVRMR